MITSTLRYEVLRRDGFQCQACGQKSPEVELEVDHVRPVALGGLDIPENLQVLCRTCNRGKSATPADAAMVEEVRDRSEVFLRARAKAVEIHRKERARAEAVIRTVKSYWNMHRFGRESIPQHEWEAAPKPDNWESTLREFLLKGLTEEEALELVDLAAKKCKSPDTMWGCFYWECSNHMEQVDALTRRLVEYGFGDLP